MGSLLFSILLSTLASPALGIGTRVRLRHVVGAAVSQRNSLWTLPLPVLVLLPQQVPGVPGDLRSESGLGSFFPLPSSPCPHQRLWAPQL